ncbi:MAG: hypothetical protein HY751_08715 [Nitrospinae bacterium]|nr:hypothetical protein [Nitrospinota bacterium]
MKKQNLTIALAMVCGLAFFPACASMPDSLIWKNDETGAPQPLAKRPADNEPDAEITPVSLNGEKVNPITQEEAVKTALSRPKVVKVEELSQDSKKQYFDVVDERSQTALAPVIDPAARPIRVVTYDNNSVQKDYPMRFGVAWNRVVESILDLPLEVVDRSSGVIITGWIYDESRSGDGMLSLNPLAGMERKIRYKYTVRILDRGNLTQLKVVPFAESIKGQRWEGAKASILITNRLFDRLEKELAVPLPSEQ